MYVLCLTLTTLLLGTSLKVYADYHGTLPRNYHKVDCVKAYVTVMSVAPELIQPYSFEKISEPTNVLVYHSTLLRMSTLSPTTNHLIKQRYRWYVSNPLIARGGSIVLKNTGQRYRLDDTELYKNKKTELFNNDSYTKPPFYSGPQLIM